VVTGEVAQSRQKAGQHEHCSALLRQVSLIGVDGSAGGRRTCRRVEERNQRTACIALQLQERWLPSGRAASNVRRASTTPYSVVFVPLWPRCRHTARTQRHSPFCSVCVEVRVSPLCFFSYSLRFKNICGY
jgi:hypothetical protein